MSMPNVGVEGTGHWEVSRGGLYFPKNSSGLVVTAKTAAYTVLPLDAWKAFSNEGAAGSVTFTLPSDTKAVVGAMFHFLKITAQNVVIAVPSGVTLDGLATRTNSAAEAGAAMITIVCISLTKYQTFNAQGTWALA